MVVVAAVVEVARGVVVVLAAAAVAAVVAVVEVVIVLVAGGGGRVVVVELEVVGVALVVRLRAMIKFAKVDTQYCIFYILRRGVRDKDSFSILFWYCVVPR